MIRLAVWTTVAALVACTLLVATLQSQDQGIAWHDTLEDALAASEESGKLVMLSLHTEWCYWCGELEKQTWPAKAVIEKSKEFECVQVDPEKTPTDERYDDGSYPRILFINSEGDIVYEIGGFAQPEPFAKEMAAANEAAKQFAEAQELEKKLEENPEDYRTAYRAGHLYLEIGNAKKAVSLLATAYEHVDELDEADRAEAAYDYGSALLYDRRFEEGLDILKAAIEAHPDHERVWEGRFGLGYCHANLDQLAEAREEWKAVAKSKQAGPLRERAKELVQRVDAMLGEE